MLSYSALAKFYDKIILDGDYERWIDYIVSVVKEYVKSGKGIDCACGSGIATVKLKKAGFNVTGVDVSREMLVKAQEFAVKEKLNIPFLLQDMKKLKVFEKVDFITVINDGINYLTQKELSSAFASFYKSLNKGGTLIFDFSSEYKLKTVLGNNMFGDDGKDLSYIWFNTLNEDSVDMSLTFFEKDGDVYKRTEETQTQYIHTVSDVISALENAKFNVKRVTDGNGEELTKTSQRVLVIATRD